LYSQNAQSPFACLLAGKTGNAEKSLPELGNNAYAGSIA
jgi:hypothetical protein